MWRLSREELASLIDAGRLRNYVSGGIGRFRKKTIEEEDKSMNVGQVIKVTLTVIFVIGLVCAAAYGVYRLLHKDYDDDFDEFDDAFDDDYDFYDDDFEEEEEVVS